MMANLSCSSFQNAVPSYESELIREAHGLIIDMLVDTSLPPNVVSGLRAVSSLLKPPDNHMPVSRPRVSPLVSLTESTNYSDSEDLPYTGERPSSLPKVYPCTLYIIHIYYQLFQKLTLTPQFLPIIFKVEF